MTTTGSPAGRSRLTVAAVILGGLAGLFPSLVLITSLPDIAVDLGTGVDSLRWALTAPLLASAVCLPVAGKLSDTYGHRRVFALGLVLVLCGSIAIALSWNGTSFIVFRTLTQVAGIAIQPAGLSLLNSGVPPEQRAKAFSWWALVVAAGPALGLGLGGPLTEVTDWTSVFYVQAVLALGAVALARALPLTAQPARLPGPFDAAGAILLGLTALSVVVLIDQSIALGIGHDIVKIAGVSALVAGLLFWLAERRAANPVVPARLIADRNFNSAVAAQFFTQATSMGTVTVTPLLMRSQLGLSTSEASFMLMTMPIAFAVAAPIGGRVAGRQGHRRSALIGTVLLVAGGLLLTAAAVTTSLPLVILGLAGIGGGGGICKPGYTLAVAGSGGSRDVGIAVASERMFTQIGSTLGVATLLSIVAGGERGDFALAAFVAASFSALALVVALVFVGRRRLDAGTGELPADMSLEPMVNVTTPVLILGRTTEATQISGLSPADPRPSVGPPEMPPAGALDAGMPKRERRRGPDRSP